MVNEFYKTYTKEEFKELAIWRQDYITKNKPLYEKYKDQWDAWYEKHKVILSKREIYAKLDALIAANHADMVALKTKLTEITPRQAVSAVYTSSSLADDGVSSKIDADDFSYMTICASQGSANLPLEIQYSINGSNWFKVRSKLLTFVAYEGGSCADILLEHPYEICKICKYE